MPQWPAVLIESLTLAGIAFVGTTLWVVSPEVSSVFYGSSLGWPPLAVGVVCAVGQGPAYGIYYVGGARLVARWRWLGVKVSRTRDRLGDRLERHYLLLTALASLTGMPPVIAMCALGAGFGVRPWALFPVVVTGRLIRFSLLAAGGEWVSWAWAW